MKITGVLLAAGNSTRFGGDKLQQPLANGESIGSAAARTLLSAVDQCVAVVRETPLRDSLLQLGCDTVLQPNPAAGMGNSLALGVRASQDADAWLIALADMPWLSSATVQRVVAALRAGAPIVVPMYNGQRGHPVGFAQSFRAELLALDGDQGAKVLLLAHAAKVQYVAVSDAGVVRDVDRREDLGSQ